MKHAISTLVLFCALFAFILPAWATIRYVDKNGVKGPYKTIQSAINAAIDGDTVRILPGIYTDTVNIGKNIVVQGGGVLNTTISAQTITSGAAVTITAGKLMWVTISSSNNGLAIKNATVSNCVFYSCTGTGVDCNGGTNAILINCIANNCGNGFVEDYPPDNIYLTAINCIAFKNQGDGFLGTNIMVLRYCNAYGNGTDYTCYGNPISGFSCPTKTNCLNVDPGFGQDWRLSSTSGCKNTGDPTILNLDGSRSDMGYYGGPDAPLLPYVTAPYNMTLQPDGTVHFDMTGKVGY